MGAFYALGVLNARRPAAVALGALALSLLLCLGLLQMRVQTDPHGIWVPPESVAAREQARFNELFGPFFRVNQLIFYVDDAANDSASLDLVQREFLLKAAQVQTAIERTSVAAEGGNRSLSLADFCYRPIKGKGCLVTSPFQFWRGDAKLLEEDPDIKLTTACQTTDETLKQFSPCMDQNGVPVMRNVVFGGIERDDCHQNPDPCGEATPKAKALMVTFLLHNYPDNETYTADVEQWEKDVFLAIAESEGISLAKSASSSASDNASGPFDGMKLTYMAERSVPDSLVVQTKQNAFVVVVSYLVMFLYVSMSLGKFTDPVHSRFGLGLTGIIIVLLALGIAMGVSSMFHMEVTMITLEVVPFLILAIGVDNMFILTNEFDRLSILRAGEGIQLDDMMLAQILGETMTNVGPSIVVAAVAETLAFLVGALTKIPALTSFCVVAAIAVVADFALQMTWFAAALILDTKRVRARRFDLLPFVKQTIIFAPKKRPSISRTGAARREQAESVEGGRIQWFIAKKYAPALLKRSTKLAVLVTASFLLALSGLGFSQLELGLDQELAVPTDFYLHKYFEMQTKYGEAGPLGYVVLGDELVYTDAAAQMDAHDLASGLGNLQEFVQLPVSSWLQTFNQWRQLRYFLRDKIKTHQCDCPEQPMAPFKYELAQNSTSTSTNKWRHDSRTSSVFGGFETPRLRADLAGELLIFNDHGAMELDSLADGEVTPDALFFPLVRNFTQISIDSQCCQHFGLCGAQFESDIVFQYDTAIVNEAASDLERPVIGIAGSRFRFQLSAMTNQTMFVNSYFYLHDLTSKWSHRHHELAHDDVGPAFPYALTFVYYEQYTYIQGIALQSIFLALAVVLMAVFMLMEQNLRLSVLVGLCVLSMTVTQIGFLYVWNELSSVSTAINAVSVVNLLACVGLGVEFCVHTAHQFAYSQKLHGVSRFSGNDHAANALATVGGSILSGITLTKFCGIGVLAFAPSMLFRVYFFRMYMGIVVLGFFHGLVLLPVLLSLFGQHAEYPDDFGSFLLSEERDDEFEDERGAYQ